MTLVWTPHAECHCPKMVLGRTSPPLLSGLWRETEHLSPSVPWIISPDPLPTQSPAHHLPAAQSSSPSPPLTKSPSSPQLSNHRHMERQSDRATDRRGAGAASDLSPGVWAGYNTHFEGQCDHSVITERSAEEDLIDWYADTPPLLPPSSEPSVTPVPTSSPERAAVPTSCPEMCSGFHVQPREGSGSWV